MPHRLGPMQTLPAPTRKFADSEEVDYCIVGVGSAGGVLVQRLARAGFRVVGLEAGPVLGHRTRLGERRKRLAQALLERSAHHRRRAIPSPSARTTAEKASAAAPCTGPRSRRAFIPPTFASTR